MAVRGGESPFQNKSGGCDIPTSGGCEELRDGDRPYTERAPEPPEGRSLVERTLKLMDHTSAQNVRGRESSSITCGGLYLVACPRIMTTIDTGN